jgi:magnesium chelatase subunit D
VLFVVDASGSMAAQRRLAVAKGAVTGLLMGNYQRRDEVAVIVFRGETAELILPFTRDVAWAESTLREVPTGGRTPLTSALCEAQRQMRGTVPTFVVLFTDGRANVSVQGADAWQEALAAAGELATMTSGALVVDCEAGPVTFDRARELASVLKAEWVRLDQLDASNLTLRLQRQLTG